MKRDETSEKKFVDYIWQKAVALAVENNLVCPRPSCNDCEWQNLNTCRTGQGISFGFLKCMQSVCKHQDNYLLLDELIKEHFIVTKNSNNNNENTPEL